MQPVPSRLLELESRIERGLETFVDVGLALLEIRDSRLYRESSHTTFDDYCRERWGFSKSRANQLIDAANLTTIVAIPPANEAQARELARLKEPETIREVWQEVRESTPEPTARDIRQAVDRRINPPQHYVCTDCGQVHPTRECPDCAETAPEPVVRHIPALPPVQQLTAEERAYHQIFQLLDVIRLNPTAVAEAAPSADSAHRLLSELSDRNITMWATIFKNALERQTSGALRVVR